MITTCKRNSGATVSYPCFLKTSTDERLSQEATIMMRHPKVFCPIISTGGGAHGHYMALPLLTPYSAATPEMDVQAALKKLGRLWGYVDTKYVDAYRAQYQAVIMALDAPNTLRRACARLYTETEAGQGLLALAVHGDATLENTVYDAEQSAAWWIDPSPRLMPLEREADAGKLLVSIRGYDFVTEQVKSVATQFFAEEDLNPALMEYYFFTHLIRIWKQQVARRDWIMSFVGGGQ